MTVRDNTAPQCPYCPTLMLFVRPLHHGRSAEWLCPACKMTKEWCLPSPEASPEYLIAAQSVPH
jgi:transposase-like protein